jgi:hypothetical protein
MCNQLVGRDGHIIPRRPRIPIGNDFLLILVPLNAVTRGNIHRPAMRKIQLLGHGRPSPKREQKRQP